MVKKLPPSPGHLTWAAGTEAYKVFMGFSAYVLSESWNYEAGQDLLSSGDVWNDQLENQDMELTSAGW